jgi:hypothetical protein
VRTEYAVIQFEAPDQAGAEALAADPERVESIALLPPRWQSGQAAALRGGVVTDVTDAWAAGVAMVAARDEPAS